MKAHAMRRSIWFLNVALIAAIVGIGAWWFVDVREAVASVPKPVGPKRKAPAQYLTMVKSFNTDLESARTDVLRAPVKLATLQEVVLRADYKEKDPTHFIFTGPLPPATVKKKDDGGPAKPAAPKGLNALGKIDWLIFAGESDSMIAFLFKSNKTGYFNIGEFVKDGKKKPDRFKIVKATSPEPGLYKIAYEVYDEGKDEAVDTGELEWDNRKIKPAKGESVIYIDPASIKVTEPAAAVKDAEGGTVGEDDEPGKPPGEPITIQPETVKPAEDLTHEDLKPKIKEVNRSLVDIKFDDNTRRYFSKKGAEKLAESVKTEIAKDKNGNTLGLRLIDSGEVPADVLQIHRGDIIVSVDGVAVKERADIRRIAEGLDENTPRVTIVIDRQGRKITYQVDPRDPKTRRAAAAYADRELDK